MKKTTFCIMAVSTALLLCSCQKNNNGNTAPTAGVKAYQNDKNISVTAEADDNGETVSVDGSVAYISGIVVTPTPIPTVTSPLIQVTMTPTPTPSPTPTPIPTDTPTPTPIPTDAPVPTERQQDNTPVPPKDTESGRPTDVPKATNTPRPTNTPVAHTHQWVPLYGEFIMPAHEERDATGHTTWVEETVEEVQLGERCSICNEIKLLPEYEGLEFDMGGYAK